jgi:ketosteroid isomerase-like protein
MVKKGDSFHASVRIPPSTLLNYKFLITKTSRGLPVNIWQDFNGQDFYKLVRINGSLDEKATVSLVTPEQRTAWMRGDAADLPLVRQDIVYRAPGAAEVWLVWGLDGWHTVPESIRPQGTLIRDGSMHTRMSRNGDQFMATVRFPPGSELNYSFLISRTADGKITEVRQHSDEKGRPLTRLVNFSSREEIRSTAWLSGDSSTIPLLNQDIRYRIGGTDEVWLVWGINGWQPVPEGSRPAGTVIKDHVMHTRMPRKGSLFSAIVRVPEQSALQYKFLVTKRSDGTPTTIWEDNHGQAFEKRLARLSGVIEERATVSVLTAEERKTWMAGASPSDVPMVEQQVRLQAPGFSEVWLVWGVEGWHPVPERNRPQGTILKDGRMHTPIARDGHTFAATVHMPPGTEFNFLFLIAKTDDGKTVNIRQEQDADGRALSRLVASDETIEVLLR